MFLKAVTTWYNLVSPRHVPVTQGVVFLALKPVPNLSFPSRISCNSRVLIFEVNFAEIWVVKLKTRRSDEERTNTVRKSF